MQRKGQTETGKLVSTRDTNVLEMTWKERKGQDSLPALSLPLAPVIVLRLEGTLGPTGSPLAHG